MQRDPELAAAWWEPARDLLVEEWFGWKVIGFNDRFRFYRTVRPRGREGSNPLPSALLPRW